MTITYSIPGEKLHDHDCADCEFLGNATLPEKFFRDSRTEDGERGDMYVCRRHPPESVVYRWGSHPDHYTSDTPEYHRGGVDEWLSQRMRYNSLDGEEDLIYYPGGVLQMAWRLSHDGY